MAGKATLHGRYDNAPEYAEHNSSGKGGTALHMLELVLAFERKLTMFARDLQRSTLSHVPSLREFKQAHNIIDLKYLQSAITGMQTSFDK